MVNIIREVVPKTNASEFNFEAGGKFVIPTQWLFYHMKMSNLVLTKSLRELRDGSMTDSALFNLLTQFNMTDVFEGYKYNFVVNCWSTDKQWIGYLPTLNQECIMHYFVNDVEKFSNFYNCIYYVNESGNAASRVAAKDEYNYNAVMMDYFSSKFPVSLKSYAPVYGEENALLG